MPSAPSSSPSSGPKRKFLAGPRNWLTKKRQEAWAGTKESVKEGSKGIVGGILDATALNVYQTLKDIMKGPVKETVQAIVEPIGRAGLAVKELATLHPGKAVTQLALGLEKGVEHAVNLGRTSAETAANTITRVSRGIARAIAGAVGENILGERYKDLLREKTVQLKAGLEALATGEPHGESMIFAGASAGGGGH